MIGNTITAILKMKNHMERSSFIQEKKKNLIFCMSKATSTTVQIDAPMSKQTEIVFLNFWPENVKIIEKFCPNSNIVVTYIQWVYLVLYIHFQ